ncbi:phosphoenolpyruvate carboxykinase (ATP) [Sphingobacterium wenxiniae]|uniref:Phosphoenolpyruvate carboxykinase (ATP) n=1 Tax=Sphingobacterium wenxiniae TaxID=683125 RepID=A0A1I6TZR7_9SPHI|nr:phosphoenolpyruvate carboxykinase (ATP) [Sphingobacterium wenxiniae]SFS94716.1 phosphoenolpyruvate carboxykinase (ATP) [Sphingobacterium wenxiniae]
MVIGLSNPINKANLHEIAAKVYWDLDATTLVQETLKRGQGVLNDQQALCITTGKFTGRSPKDRFIVKDNFSEKIIDWGDVNIPISEEVFEGLYEKMLYFLADKEVWARHCYAGADTAYRIPVTVINTTPWANLFCHHLFLRPNAPELENFPTDGWTIIQIPEFLADPTVDGTRQENFAILNFSRRTILIGGTAYTGEMKKGIFSVLNCILPYQYDTLSMHCSANEGKKGDTALFFGLSGTGKTTLSADPTRNLIGDDEHGWAQNSIFNFEGGCYAKCIDLSAEKEPEIYAAIKETTLLENVTFYENTNTVDFSNARITENTRAAYPIYHIPNAKEISVGSIPRNIFFLTCDAFGVLPPISKLTKAQAMYHFLSGYTAKVAGTEVGIVEPQTTFSACFGRVFLPLHPTKYAELLGKKLEQHPDVNVWLINTGWTGGAYGEGKRISLKYTRAMVQAALEGKLDNVNFEAHQNFGVWIPQYCPNVPDELLNPKDTWDDKGAYNRQANTLATLFNNNFNQYKEHANEEILLAAPKMI